MKLFIVRELNGHIGGIVKKSKIVVLAACGTVLSLSACTSSPNQNDIYACEDWASAYSTMANANTEDNVQLSAILKVTADSYESASSEATNSELSNLISQLSSFYASAARMVDQDNPDLLNEIDVDDKDIYRKCVELKINPVLDADNLPDWYKG